MLLKKVMVEIRGEFSLCFAVASKAHKPFQRPVNLPPEETRCWNPEENGVIMAIEFVQCKVAAVIKQILTRS